MDIRSYTLGFFALTSVALAASDPDDDITMDAPANLDGTPAEAPSAKSLDSLPAKSLVDSAPTPMNSNDGETPAPADESTTRLFADRPRAYDYERPSWAFQMGVTLQGLGKPYRLTGDPYSYNVRGATLEFDYEPKFLQAFGVFSIGPNLSYFGTSGITTPDAQISPPQLTQGLGLWSYGISARYQARFVNGQKFVPYAGFEAQNFSYKLLGVAPTNGSAPTVDPNTGGTYWKGSSWVSGPVIGAMLLLNWLEPEMAQETYNNWGLKRSYLFAEGKVLNSTDHVVDTDGAAIYFGFRIEY